MEQNLKKIFIGPSRKYACNGISFLDHLRNTLFIIICFLVILKLSTNARGRKTKMKSDNFWHVSNEKFANLDVKHRDVCTSRLITRRWCGERSRTKRMMRRRRRSRKRRFTRKHAYYIVRFPRVDRTDVFFTHTPKMPIDIAPPTTTLLSVLVTFTAYTFFRHRATRYNNTIVNRILCLYVVRLRVPRIIICMLYNNVIKTNYEVK